MYAIQQGVYRRHDSHHSKHHTSQMDPLKDSDEAMS